MPKIAEREDKLGNLLKMESGKEWGFCRETMSVTLTPSSDIGDVLYDNAGDLALVAQVNTANASAVLIDPTVVAKRPATGSTVVNVAVLVRGPSVVADAALNFNADINTDGEKQALYDVLKGLGIVVRKQV
jgi:hypothetical protein